MIELPLLPIPRKTWLGEYAAVLSDEYTRRKYDRTARLREKLAYIDDCCPEVKQGGGTVLDIGCGPGEYLECCRAFGNKIYGIDARHGDGGMGHPYLKLSQLLCERQRIPVWYEGLLALVRAEPRIEAAGQWSLINAQGSIEQCFAHRMDGVPHHVHKNCKLLAWRVDDVLRAEFRAMMQRFRWLLKPGGAVLIYANGAANTEDYTREIKAAAEATGLDLVREEHKGRLHRWQRSGC